jgi:hypothetical protein
MKLRSMLLASALGLGLTVAGGQAFAVPFQGTFNVVANSGDGLIINTAPNVQSGFGSGNSIHFDLTNPGDSVTFRLFDIWTPETAVNWGDDIFPKPITVNFDFVLPPPAFGGSADGSTVSGLFGTGFVDWNNPAFIHFGEQGDGVLQVSLEDESFNGGFFGLGLTGGEGNGANVKVTFKLKHEATTEVPEPGTLAVLGLGLVGLAAVRRRKAA